jgi:D-3-phosphoglycerate dehydrogenase
MKVLVTCPPMLKMIEDFYPIFKKSKIEITAPKVIQTLSVEELCKIVPQHHGWIIGDDPATREVFEAGKKGNLIAAVKWGVGVDNVDFKCCKDLAIPIVNTPNMFGNEVADIAVGYLIALARETFNIHNGVQRGEWPKPQGISLDAKTVAIIGLGDIGLNVAKRLLSMGMKINGYDPAAKIPIEYKNKINHLTWPQNITEADFIVITCALTESSYHMINDNILRMLKKGVRIVNVGRGPIIDEISLEKGLKSEIVYSAALDVYEQEPLPMESYLRTHPRCIFGSHNASNTKDAVIKTSHIAIEKLLSFLKNAEN